MAISSSASARTLRASFDSGPGCSRETVSRQACSIFAFLSSFTIRATTSGRLTVSLQVVAALRQADPPDVLASEVVEILVDELLQSLLFDLHLLVELCWIDSVHP